MFLRFNVFKSVLIASPPVIEFSPVLLLMIIYDLLYDISCVSFDDLFSRVLINCLFYIKSKFPNFYNII